MTFGEWTLRKIGKEYRAETNGFVVAYSRGENHARCDLKTKPPQGEWQLISRCTHLGSGTMPVRKGDFYKVIYVEDPEKDTRASTLTAHWLPIE